MFARILSLSAALAGCLFLVLATPAQAQMRVCGPGEQPVAFDNNVNPPVPLCPGGGPAAAPVAESHAAMAWHEDAADVWVDGAYTGRNSRAESNALAACARVMGEGCKVAGSWGNSTLYVYRNRFGDFFAAYSANSAGIKKAEADCKGKGILPCERIMKFASNKREHFPGQEVRKRYLAAAWVNGKEGYDGKLYIASGQPTYKAAEDAAVSACRKANAGRECMLQSFSGNGVLQIYQPNEDSGAVVDNTPDRAVKAAKAWCKQMKARTCILGPQYDARTPGLFVHDFKAGDAK